MGADIIQVDYAKLDDIAYRFRNRAEETEALYQRLSRGVDQLVDGDWVGHGAHRFLAEMQTEVLPAVRRLIQALQAADGCVLEISEIIHSAEETAASVFTGEQTNAWSDFWHNLLGEPSEGDQSHASLLDQFLRSGPGQSILSSANAVWAFVVGSGHEFGESYGPGATIGATAGEVASSFLLWGDVRDLAIEGYNFIHPDREVNEWVAGLAAAGIVGDLGWLDGPVPDPVDGANLGAAALKALVKRLDDVPASVRESSQALIQWAIKHPDKLDDVAGVARWLIDHHDSPGGRAIIDLVAHGGRQADQFGHAVDAATWLTHHEDLAGRLLHATSAPSDLIPITATLSRLPPSRTLPTTLPQPNNLYGYSSADMPHFLDSHTYDYLNPGKRVNKQSTTMWPTGTSSSQVRDYLQESLGKLDAAGTHLTGYSKTRIQLGNGITVQLGTRPGSSGTEIGQFFPLAGPGVESISKEQMRIIDQTLSQP